MQTGLGVVRIDTLMELLIEALQNVTKDDDEGSEHLLTGSFLVLDASKNRSTDSLQKAFDEFARLGMSTEIPGETAMTAMVMANLVGFTLTAITKEIHAAMGEPE
jgi:hypothetical protein